MNDYCRTIAAFFGGNLFLPENGLHCLLKTHIHFKCWFPFWPQMLALAWLWSLLRFTKLFFIIRGIASAFYSWWWKQTTLKYTSKMKEQKYLNNIEITWQWKGGRLKKDVKGLLYLVFIVHPASCITLHVNKAFLPKVIVIFPCSLFVPI